MTELRDLRLLVSLARNKSFSTAAIECCISQPAFSNRIRNMEERLNLLLVQRSNNFIGFTKEGELVLKWARRLLLDSEAMHQEITALGNEICGTLKLGVIPTAASFASTISTKLRKCYSKIGVEIFILPSSRIASGVDDFSLDAGIAYSDDAELNITIPLYVETYSLVAREELVKDLTDPVSWNSVCDVPLALLTSNMRNRQIIDNVFNQLNLLPNVVTQASDFVSVFSQVVHGNAATVAPKDIADTLLTSDGIKKFTLVNPSVQNQVGLLLQKQSPTLPLIRALKEVL